MQTETPSFTKEELLRIKGDTPVAGFEEFWRAQYAAARNWKCSYTVESELWSPSPDCRIFRIRFTSIDGIPIGMWIARPRESTGGLLSAHGYGHPTIPPVAASPGRTVAVPCVRGLGLSQCKEISHKLQVIDSYPAVLINTTANWDNTDKLATAWNRHGEFANVTFQDGHAGKLKQISSSARLGANQKAWYYYIDLVNLAAGF